MSKIRGKDTKPELKLRKALFAKGFRYRVNVRTLPGKPDIVLRKYKSVIFVNGCFWHGHKDCKLSHLPASNVHFWETKILANRKRDALHTLQLEAEGWNVITIWECEMKHTKDLEMLVEDISAELKAQLALPNKIVKYKYPRYEEAVHIVAEQDTPLWP